MQFIILNAMVFKGAAPAELRQTLFYFLLITSESG